MTSSMNSFSQEPSYAVFNEITKSSLDDREYRYIHIKSNGLCALVISDPKAEKSSAALDCHVGHMSDPPQVPGLAHFCEHLLFMGTEKYPSENEYSQYLAEHGGYSNAFTGAENTNYYFEVTADHLEGALDRFAQFFIAPLFNDSCTDREMNAVDSEHKKNIQQDHWRLYQLEKDLSHPEHPYSKFGSGSMETLKTFTQELGLDIREILLSFHNKFYSANIMKLVVLGKESLETLTKWVVEKFSLVPNKDILVPSPLDHPFTERELKKLIKVKSVKDIRCLELIFKFPGLDKYYRSHPNAYISHLIGHESEGSILSLLKKRGWASGLAAGYGSGGTHFGFFRISVELTDDGLEHYEDVAVIVFQYINMIQTVGVKEWIFEECRSLSELQFRFKEKSSAATYCSHLAGRMHTYPKEYVLSGPYVIMDFEPKLIESLMNQLNVENFRILLVSPTFDATSWMKARWYQTEYCLNEIPESLLQKLRAAVMIPELHLPAKNEFVPKDFSVVETIGEPISHPFLIYDTNVMRLWYKKDDRFSVPKCHVWFLLRTPYAYTTPLACVMSKMMTELLKEALTELSYYAECAGLSYDFDNKTEGLQLVLGGYNDKVGVLMRKIVERLRSFSIDADRFNIIKEKQLRVYQNWYLESAHSHAMYYVNYVTQEKIWHADEKITALQNLDVTELCSFRDRVYKQLHIEGFVHGNMEAKNAIQLAKLVQQTLNPLSLSKFQRFETMRNHLIPPGSSHIFVQPTGNPENPNSAIEYYLQIGEYTNVKLRATLGLFAHVSHEPCFDQLRTKEQLGYLVFSGVRKQIGILGYRVIIQSEFHPLYLESRIEAFLMKMKDIIEKMTDGEFEKYTSSLKVKLLEKHKNLEDESKSLWSHISSHYYDFKQNEKDADIVGALTKQDLIDFVIDHVSLQSPLRKKLSVWITSQRFTDYKNSLQEAIAFLPQMDSHYSPSPTVIQPDLENIIAKNNCILMDQLVDFKCQLSLSKSATPVVEWKSFQLQSHL